LWAYGALILSATDLADIEAKLDWLEREMDEVEQQARSLQERVHRRIQDLSTSDQEPTTPLRLGLFPILQFADRKNCSGSTAATLPHFVVPLSPESRRLQS
jgi:hypothetical protein